MSNEFKIIETQEQLNEVIGERLRKAEEKAEAKAAEKFKDWTSPEELEKIRGTFNDEIKKLNETISAGDTLRAEKDQAVAERDQYRTDLEKTRIAIEAGLGMKYADRLKGTTEEEWKKDAEALAKDFGRANTAPLGGAEPVITKEASTREQFAEWVAENINK